MILHKMNNNLIQNKLFFHILYFIIYSEYIINLHDKLCFTQLTMFSDNKENIVHSMSREHTVKNVHRGQNYRAGEIIEFFVFYIQAYGEIRSTHKLDIPCTFSIIECLVDLLWSYFVQ